MSRTLAPEPGLDQRKRTAIGSVSDGLARMTGAAGLLDAVIVFAFFVVLPVDRVGTFDAAGFTVRPAYPLMGLFLLLHLRSVRSGFRAMPTAALVALAVVVSLPLTFDPKRSIGYAVWAFFTIGFALAAIGYLREDERRMPAWTELYCATAAGWALVLIGEWFVSFKDANIPYGWLGSLPRLHGLSVESSFIAFYLVAPLFLCLAARRRIWAIPIVFALVLTTSRTGIIGMTVGALVLLVVGNRSHRIAVVKAALVAGVAVVALAVPVAVNYQPIGTVPGAVLPEDARLGSKARRIDEDFLTLNDTSSTAGRVQSVKDAVATYRQAPLTGVGIGAYGQASHERGAYLEEPTSRVLAMSLWLEALAELGPLGLIVLFVWAFVPVPFLWRLRAGAPLAVPLIAAILASAAMFMAAQTWWVPYRWIPWILAYALVAPMLVATLARWTRRAPAA
jgi:O-antigen ligase